MLRLAMPIRKSVREPTTVLTAIAYAHEQEKVEEEYKATTTTTHHIVTGTGHGLIGDNRSAFE